MPIKDGKVFERKQQAMDRKQEKKRLRIRHTLP